MGFVAVSIAAILTVPGGFVQDGTQFKAWISFRIYYANHISNFFTFKDFTPHMFTVNVGEDVVSKLMGLPMGPRSLTIISARGAVVYVTIRHPSGLHQNFQGVHKILFLSLSCLNEITLEVGLSDPNGKFIVGVASLLIAGTPVEIILGSFIQNSGNKQQIKSKFPVESSMAMATTTTTTTTTSNALGPPIFQKYD
ncbi:AT-hook motif nuclear-localized protein 7-like [Humulus lupulus]|uniref:AT-hook motif nuclear-localized protein 7-like n=1 Tax=Humulus lupulus TaxID=3486 RepID=UPI002B415F75|nr:AT-hook motif nuclear-localized protein 7-like [Humulus lupulus]